MILKIQDAELYDLMKSFYNLTGIKTAIYNAEFEEILSYPQENSRLCSEIRKQGRCGCEKSNQLLFEQCQKCDDVVIRRCHAGLTEAAAPIVDQGLVIGYIMYGQILDRADFEENRKERPLYADYPEELISEIQVYSEDQLKAVSKIFLALTSYIMLKNYIYTEEKPVIYSVLEYIQQNLGEDLSVEALCREFGVSRSELYKLSKPYMPDGIAEFVKRARLNKAAELLHKTKKPIWEIAEETGFLDKDYFLRVFKRCFGVSAGKYRKEV